LRGVVASPLEIASIREACGVGFVILMPEIRHPWVDIGDQRRTMTPGQAVAAGSDCIVVGRPITSAAGPKAGRTEDRLRDELAHRAPSRVRAVLARSLEEEPFHGELAAVSEGVGGDGAELIFAAGGVVEVDVEAPLGDGGR